MDERSTDQRDCTPADIVQLGDEFKRLWVSHRQGEVAARKIINLIALLIQSARTRIVLLRTPQAHIALTPELLEQQVLTHTFRYETPFQSFLKQLTDKLHSTSTWLSEHTVTIQEADASFNLCLVRIHKADDQSETWFWQEDENQSLAKSYQRVKRLIQHLHEEKLLAWVVNCFQESVPIMPVSEWVDGNILIPTKPSPLLKPVYDWVNQIYQEYGDLPLLQVASTQGKTVDYSNIFFFVRLWTQDSNDEGNFTVGLIVPELQQREFSQFFQRERESACQWYITGGGCRIPRIKTCLFNETWKTLSPDETDWDKVHQHFKSEHWELLENYSTGKPTLAGAAFKTQTIIFERRNLHIEPRSSDSSIHSRYKADQVLHCLKCRLVPAPELDKEYNEDCMPQILFTPMYSSSTPILTVATVVNAHRPAELQAALSEWQYAVQFAGMVYRYLANRFKERARKGYLGGAGKIIESCYESTSRFARQNSEPEKIANEFINTVNQQLAKLSKIYSYPQLYLSLDSIGVINNDIQDDQSLRLIAPWFCHCEFNISIHVYPSTYWLKPSGRQLFNREDVVRKFKTAIDRARAREQLNALINMGKFLPKSGEGQFD